MGKLRQSLARPLGPVEIAITLITTAIVILLLLAGQLWFALLGLVAPPILGILLLRPRTKRLEEAVELHADCATVWSFIHPAENAPLIDRSIVRGYRVPGTPDGVGERQALERANGETTIIEVVEFAPGRRAVVDIVSPRPANPTRAIYELTPSGSGCVLLQATEVQLRRGQFLNRSYAEAWRSETLAMTTQLKQRFSSKPWAPPVGPQ